MWILWRESRLGLLSPGLYCSSLACRMGTMMLLLLMGRCVTQYPLLNSTFNRTSCTRTALCPIVEEILSPEGERSLSWDLVSCVCFCWGLRWFIEDKSCPLPVLRAQACLPCWMFDDICKGSHWEGEPRRFGGAPLVSCGVSILCLE